MSTAHFAQTTDFAFVNELLTFGEDYAPQPGDTVEFDDLETTSGEPFPCDSAKVVSRGEGSIVLQDPNSGQQVEASTDGWFRIVDSPAITSVFEQHLRRPCPDGVSFADGVVDSALIERLRADVQRLIELEPVDYHPGSGTKVRDLVHPSLYPYIEGRSVLRSPAPNREQPSQDRFGRPFESSSYQWLPTPFHVAQDGKVSILSYINNLDRTRHAAAYDDLAALFSTALPLIESVVGYVESTKFWQEECAEIEHEGELPDHVDQTPKPAPPTSLRGREVLVIPKIVEYRLGAGETHEGVWHVEGMSHEHIIATCVYILDRDESLEGGELRFKRAYTVEEAGLLFWNIDQCRPSAVEQLIDEGTIPIGSVATPEGRIIVFPNSHIHKLSQLSVAAGATEGRRRVIVFWIVDPSVTILSTRDVSAQQGIIPHADALSVRLELMEERRRHKQSLNVRAVSLCEH
ncbi:MAG: DUF4246 family protein [Myxococcales bacterium]|jgi:hypothetical protein|nr:DUF4246 family protein [Myxococcales bacterium]